MKKFKNVKSCEDLKEQYKKLIKAKHPDNGGDVEAMKEINIQYDALFTIWKDRHEKETGETVTETAGSTRRHFYTQFGWCGENYDGNLMLKEIAKIVRAYVKKKYPLDKFSVRRSYDSMCQELHVDIKEFNGRYVMIANDFNDFVDKVSVAIKDTLNSKNVGKVLLKEMLKEKPGMTPEEWDAAKSQLMTYLFLPICAGNAGSNGGNGSSCMGRIAKRRSVLIDTGQKRRYDKDIWLQAAMIGRFAEDRQKKTICFNKK